MLDRRAAGRTGLTAATAVGVLSASAGVVPVPLELLVAAAVGVALAAMAFRWPLVAVTLGSALAICLPYYAGRYVAGTLGLTPFAAVCLVLLPAAIALRGEVRLRLLDVAVGALVLLRAVALTLNYSGGIGGVAALVLGVALPYAVFRLLGTRADVRHALAWVVVLTAIPLALVGLRERAGVPNPFFAFPAQYQAAQWAHPEFRGGGVRAEASFGHPIAFGLYLALALVLALALALTARLVWQRAVAAVACALALLALTATLSRGPMLVAALGAVAWLAVSVGRLNVVRVGAVAGVLVVAAVATPVWSTVKALASASTGDTREARSAEFRLEVLRVMADPAQLSLLGKLAPGDEGLSASLAQRVGLKSIDSEFALVYLSNGLLALVALLAAAALVTVVALRAGLSPVDRAWAVATAASYVNLTTVALLTQHAELFWISTALVACLAQSPRERVVR